MSLPIPHLYRRERKFWRNSVSISIPAVIFSLYFFQSMRGKSAQGFLLALGADRSVQMQEQLTSLKYQMMAGNVCLLVSLSWLAISFFRYLTVPKQGE